jgi:hypothetical protein
LSLTEKNSIIRQDSGLACSLVYGGLSLDGAAANEPYVNVMNVVMNFHTMNRMSVDRSLTYRSDIFSFN